jgi:hypothetical protein
MMIAVGKFLLVLHVEFNFGPPYTVFHKNIRFTSGKIIPIEKRIGWAD